MLQVWDAFELKGKGPALYCKDESFNNMSKNEIRKYLSTVRKIKIHDKNSNEWEFLIKGYDVASSISNQVAVAFLIDKPIVNSDLIIPTEVKLIQQH